MADAKLDITGDTQQAEKAIEKLVRANAKLHEQIRKLNTDSSKSYRDAEKSADGFASALGGMAARVAGVGAVAATATKVLSEWQTRVDHLAQGYKDLGDQVVKTLAEAGKLNLGPAAEKFANSQRQATPVQATQALAGVLRSGETLGDKRAFAVAGEIAKLAPTGMDLVKGGSLAADIADVLGEEATPEQVASVTIGMKQALREKTDIFQGPKFQKQVERLKQGGMSGQDALAASIAALQEEQGAEALSALNDKNKTPDQRRLIKNTFGQGQIESAKKQVHGFLGANLAGEEIQALGTFEFGRGALQQQQVETLKAQSVQQRGAAEAAYERMESTISERAYQQSQIGGAIRGAFSYANIPGRALAGTETYGARRASSAESLGLLSPDEAKEFRRTFEASIAATKELAEAMKNAAPARSVNVDQHTE